MRYQYSLGDLLLFSGITAVVLATVVSRQSLIAFVALGLSLPWVCRRPTVFRYWLVLTIGLGSGLAWFAHHREKYNPDYIGDFGMDTNELGGWGIGMLVGGAAAYWLFLRNPPD